MRGREQITRFATTLHGAWFKAIRTVADNATFLYRSHQRFHIAR